MPRAVAAPTPVHVLSTHTTFADGRLAVKQETDNQGNPHALWGALSGSSETRGRAKWKCIAHVHCRVELILSRADGGGFKLTCNGLAHTKEPPGGSKR